MHSAYCEVSDGNSDNEQDTDAYLELLMRKQNIPRTKDKPEPRKRINTV